MWARPSIRYGGYKDEQTDAVPAFMEPPSGGVTLVINSSSNKYAHEAVMSAVKERSPLGSERQYEKGCDLV